MDPRAKEGKFVGYNDKSKGYRVYWPGKNRVSVKRNIYFDQRTLLKLKEVAFKGEWELINETVDKVNKPTENPIANPKPTPSNQQLDQNKITQNDVPSNNPTTVQPNDKTNKITNPAPNPVSLNRQNSLKGLPQYDQELFGCGKHSKNTTNIVKGEGLESGGVEWEENEAETEWFTHAATAAISDDEPLIEDIINGDESAHWKKGIEEELDQIEKLGTWELVEAPPNANIIPSRWTLCHKWNAKGEIACYRVRVVAKGYVQAFGYSFKETFAPTVRPATL